MRKRLQIAEKEPSLSAGDGDGCSSYGTEHSSQGLLETCQAAVPTGLGEGLSHLNAAIAALSKGQAIMVEKLTLLEKIVGTVQFDMTWVRDDMKGVHHVMEEMSNHVCDIRAASTEVERAKEQVSVDANPTEAWEGPGHTEEFRKAPSASNSHGEQTRGHDVMPYCNNGRIDIDSYIEETEALENHVETHMNRMSSVELVRERQWGHEREAVRELWSPPCTQARVSIEDEPLEEESQRIELSCSSSQLHTPVQGDSMWSDFTAAVKDWPAPIATGHTQEEGWVSTKKGRWDTIDYGKVSARTAMAQVLEGHGGLNLNLSPDTHGLPATAWMSGDIAPSNCNVGASKNVGKETARGSIRTKRPPAVEPRYHTPVSGGHTTI